MFRANEWITVRQMTKAKLMLFRLHIHIRDDDDDGGGVGDDGLWFEEHLLKWWCRLIYMLLIL